MGEGLLPLPSRSELRVYGLVLIGNGVEFTQADEMMVPLFARIRYQYCVLRLSPVCVSVDVLAATFVVVRPVVNVALVARWIVNPVSLLELSVHFKITLRKIIRLFGPFCAVNPFGATGMAGRVTLAVFE